MFTLYLLLFFSFADYYSECADYSSSEEDDSVSDTFLDKDFSNDEENSEGPIINLQKIKTIHSCYSGCISGEQVLLTEQSDQFDINDTSSVIHLPDHETYYRIWDQKKCKISAFAEDSEELRISQGMKILILGQTTDETKINLWNIVGEKGRVWHIENPQKDPIQKFSHLDIIFIDLCENGENCAQCEKSFDTLNHYSYFFEENNFQFVIYYCRFKGQEQSIVSMESKCPDLLKVDESQAMNILRGNHDCLVMKGSSKNEKRKPGRPKGSKQKIKLSSSKQEKRKRGRPRKHEVKHRTNFHNYKLEYFVIFYYCRFRVIQVKLRDKK